MLDPNPSRQGIPSFASRMPLPGAPDETIKPAEATIDKAKLKRMVEEQNGPSDHDE